MAPRLLTLVFLTACGSGVVGDDDDARDEEITWSSEASAEFIVVDSGGRLPPLEQVLERFAAVPDFVLYGDGTTYRQAQDEFRTARIDQEGVATVLG